MKTPRGLPLVLALGTLALTGCTRGPVPIRYGQDACAHCSMTLVDQRYGAELITAKGKIHAFDDLNCLFQFQREKLPATGKPPAIYVIDFAHPGTLVPAPEAFFIHDDQLRSPMGSGLAAFALESDRATALRTLGGRGRPLRWPELPRTP